MAGDAEARRLDEADRLGVPWRRWGPYLSERQWGTVREDYSPTGDAWSSFPHDHARSRAYRWGEDGIAGISDDKQRLCFSLALWNGRDPILKERLFGLTNSEGNHGEDVKEYYFYLDSTPTHSYLSFLYKYPQAEYPYGDLVATNRARSKTDYEYELLDTGDLRRRPLLRRGGRVREGRRPRTCWSGSPSTTAGRTPRRSTCCRRCWFRNTWSWGLDGTKPAAARARPTGRRHRRRARGSRHPPALLRRATSRCCSPRTRPTPSGCSAAPNASPYVKDGIDRFVVARRDRRGEPRAGRDQGRRALRPGRSGRRQRDRTAAADRRPTWARGRRSRPGFDELIDRRRAEADEFYASLTHPEMTEEERRVVRQALAGMLWTKQYYAYDVERWLVEHGRDPLDPDSGIRNADWFHLVADDVISMPDKWEYPWFAAWDLAFHTVPLALVDIGVRQAAARPAARAGATCTRTGRCRRTSGTSPTSTRRCTPGPPTSSTSWRRRAPATATCAWLEDAFQKLVKNFTWWVNRKDADGTQRLPGRLPRPGQHRRVRPQRAAAHRRPPRPGRRHRLDGAVLPEHAADRARAGRATTPCTWSRPQTFFEHFAWIAAAMNRVGPAGAEPCGTRRTASSTTCCGCRTAAAVPLKVRSMVGLLPLAAATVIAGRRGRSGSRARRRRAGVRRPAPGGALAGVSGARLQRPATAGACSRCSTRTRLRRILARMLDEDEFLSPHGIRSRVPLPRRPPVRVRRRRPGLPGVLPAGRVRHGHVRRQLQLARTGLVPDERPADPGPAQPVRLLRRRVHRRVPDRVGAADDALPRSPRRSATG